MTLGDQPPPQLPLTGAQSGIWYGMQLYPQTAAYNIAECIQITGTTDVAALTAAISQVVASASALHYVPDVDTDGVTMGQSLRQVHWSVDIVDVQGEPHPYTAAWDSMRLDAGQPHDIATSPFRHTLYVFSATEVWWYHRVHHVLLDGFGLWLLAAEVSRVYQGLVTGQPVAGSELGSFSGVLDDEAAYACSDQRVADQQAWLTYLRDRDSAPSISAEPESISQATARGQAMLSGSLTTALDALARSHQCAVGDVLAAAWAAYIHKMSGETAVTVSLPFMNRLGRESLTVPCMVLNALPAWLTVDSETTLLSLTGQVRDFVKRFRRHGNYRYEDMRRDMGAVNSNRVVFGPTVNVMPFDYGQLFPDQTVVMHNVAAGFVEDAALHVYQRTPGAPWPVVVDANPVVIAELEAEDHCGRFVHFLERLVSEPDVPVWQTVVLMDSEADAMIQAATGPSIDWMLEDVLSLFMMQRLERPDHLAVVAAEGVRWTYTDLSSRAKLLASLFTSRGISSGDIVAMALPPMADSLAVILAAFYCDAAVMVIDADHPEHRIDQMMAVADAKLMVVAGNRIPDALQAAQHRQCPVVDVTATITLPEEAPNPETLGVDGAPCGPDSTAMVVFTSGTTGTPKGVKVTHRNLANFLCHNMASIMSPEHSELGWHVREELSAGYRLHALLTASWAFDTVWEAVSWLFGGHVLHIADEDVRLSPEAVVQYCREHEIDFLDITPTFCAELLAAGLADSEYHTPAVVSIGGEPISPTLWQRLRALDHVEWLNAYGPTECTVDVAWARASDDIAVTLGRRVHNCCALVVSPGGQVAPPGARGELWVSGTLVTAGYLGIAPKDATSFVGHSIPGVPWRRWYRTADQAMMTNTGQLQLLGRVDSQLKSRGFRIEADEITAVITADEQIRQAVVTNRKVADQDRLVAYLVLTDTATDDLVPRLRVRLAEELPYYMIPQFFEVVPDIPKSISGKVNYAALPVPCGTPVDATQAGARAEASDMASVAGVGSQPTHSDGRLSQVTAAFAQALGTPCDPDSDFFALGGHSLTAARLVAGLTKVTGQQVKLRDVFAAPTPRQLNNLLFGPADDSTTATTLEPTTPAADQPADQLRADAAVPWGGVAELHSLKEPLPVVERSAQHRVVLTGATGFLGRHVLYQLSQRTDIAEIICLVRGIDDDHAATRLQKVLRESSLDVPGNAYRTWCADATQRGWGLTSQQWVELSLTTTQVVHASAKVQHLLPYDQLRATTVGGFSDLLKWAAVAPTTPHVHVVSTLNVAADRAGRLHPGPPVAPEHLPANGYVASKWVVDAMAHTARDQGVNVSVHRPGRLTADSVTGIGNQSDALWTMLQAYVATGMMPTPDSQDLLLLPVDVFAADLVGRICAPGQPAETVHYQSDRPTSMVDVWQLLCQYGYDISAVPADAWAIELADRAADDPASDGVPWAVLHAYNELVSAASDDLPGLAPADHQADDSARWRPSGTGPTVIDLTTQETAAASVDLPGGGPSPGGSTSASHRGRDPVIRSLVAELTLRVANGQLPRPDPKGAT